MYHVELLDGTEVGIFEGERLLHSVGCLDGAHEVELVRGLADGICQQMEGDGPAQQAAAAVGEAFWTFLHVMDGQFTLGELVVLMEKVAHFLAPINRN